MRLTAARLDKPYPGEWRYIVKQKGTQPRSIYCSFCRKSENSVSKIISNPSDYPRAYICDECIAVCNSILADDRVQEPVASEALPNVDVSGGDKLAATERMSLGKLQLKQVLLANNIELSITMFENETAHIVSTITVNRGADGQADVSVNISPR